MNEKGGDYVVRQGRRPLVISIAAVSGGGKTSITSSLNERLQGSKALFFDDYDFEGPEDIREWVENGADYSAWNLASLAKNIESLMAEPLNYILLDYPFAYSHTQIGEYIDFAVFIDTPLDIAMARRVIRDFGGSTISNVISDMKNYLSRGRRAYLEMLNVVKPQSDFIVDGTLSITQITDNLAQRIEQLRDDVPAKLE